MTNFNANTEWINMVTEIHMGGIDLNDGEHCGDDRCENGVITLGEYVNADGTVDHHTMDCPVCDAKKYGEIF